MSENTESLSLFVEQLTAAQSALYGCIRTLMMGGSAAADVLQETNRVLWQKAEEYDATRPFLPWAYRIAQFQVMAHRKRQSREALVFDDALVEELAEEFAHQSALSEQPLQALEACLQKLPGNQRALVAAKYEQGEAVHVIAARMGRPVNAVSAMLYRIRNALAECITRTLAREENA